MVIYREKKIEAIRLWEGGLYNKQAIAAKLSVGTSTVYEWLKPYDGLCIRNLSCPCGVAITTAHRYKLYCSPGCKLKYSYKLQRDRWAVDDEWKSRRRQSTLKIKTEVFSYYCGGTPVCQCPSGLCKETELAFLTLDHINNDGAEHRKGIRGAGTAVYLNVRKNGFPSGFRVLCWNCNCARARTIGFKCPHEFIMRR